MTFAPLPDYTDGELLAELQAGGVDVGRPKSIKCPFHSDTHASAEVRQSKKDGKWRFYCYVCVDPETGKPPLRYDLYDIRAWHTDTPLDKVLAEASGNRGPVASVYRQPKRNPVRTYTMSGLQAWSGFEAIYTYTNPATKAPDLVVIRYAKDGGKSFVQATPTGAPDTFTLKGCAGPWPLYNRGRLAESDTCVVVEGEKCVHALHDIGIVATTSPGGAGGASRADWSHLAGKKAYLWPDNDVAGRRYRDDVAAILQSLDPPAVVHIVDVDAFGFDADDGADVVDYIETLAEPGRLDVHRQAVEDALADAKRISGGPGLADWLDAVERGEFRVLKTGFTDLDYLAKPLMAGTVTVLCGTAGSGKSFWMVQLAAHLARANTPMALYVMEDPLTVHLSRLLAQEASNGRLADPDWVENNMDAGRAANTKHKGIIEEVQRHMTQGPDAPPSYDTILAWIEAKALAGYDVIAVDPVTGMKMAERPWAADQDFLMRAKALVRQNGSRLILVTHPKSGTKKPSMDALAGGMAYNRFPHTILWMEHMPKAERVEMSDIGMEQINRQLHMVKTRNGRGQGLVSGYMFFGGSTLKFKECGVLAQ